jgi:hypothetical protein
MTVLIAANGDGSRWDGPGNKVLLPVGGAPLLARTVWMVRARGPEPHVLTSSDDVAEVAWQAPSVPPTGSLAETVLAAHALWQGEDTVLLLGDCYYGEGVMDMALGYTGHLVRAWGTHMEIYAMAWAARQSDAVEAALREAIPHGGKLWHVCRCLDGLPMRSNAVLPSFLTWVNDGTRDFDHVRAYREWVGS